MIHKKYMNSVWWVLPITIGMCLLALFVCVKPASALNQLPIPDPKPGSYGLAATKVQEPPKKAPTITSPRSGGSFTTTPITLAGVCETGLLVQVYDNGVMVGAVMCEGNSFTLRVSLFPGRNEFTAVMYDDLEQAGPTSNIVTVTYNDSRLTAFGQSLTLTSSYGRRSVPASSPLTWPLQLTGGTGPYAFSIDWGDGSDPELKSQAMSGVINISHVYQKAGIYTVNIKVTDKNGVSAFLQVIAVSSGKVDGAVAGSADTTVCKERVVWIWIPALIALLLLVPTYWLGRRSQLVSIHNKMLKERDEIAKASERH